MSMSLRQLRYFVSTAELGQITKAALTLNISQSAITTSIKELEAEVGVALFERLPQGVGLTSAGRQFLSHAYDILAKVEDASSVTMPLDGVTGSISVATTYTVMGYFLPAHLEKLKRSFPKLEIKLFELNREEIEEGLLSNRFDMAVLLTSNIQNADIRRETLLSSRRRLWVAADHHLLRLDNVGFREVAAEPYVMLTVDEAAVTAGRYWSETTFKPSIALRTFSVEAVRSIGGERTGSGDPIRHGPPPVVSREQEDRDDRPAGAHPADGRRSGLEAEARVHSPAAGLFANTSVKPPTCSVCDDPWPRGNHSPEAPHGRIGG